MSTAHSQQANPSNLEEALQASRQASLRQMEALFSEEELLQLSLLFSGKTWPLLVRCLTQMEGRLSEALYHPDTSWDRTTFIRGQCDMLIRILRLPEEMKKLKESKRDGN